MLSDEGDDNEADDSAYKACLGEPIGDDNEVEADECLESICQVDQEVVGR